METNGNFHIGIWIFGIIGGWLIYTFIFAPRLDDAMFSHRDRRETTLSIILKYSPMIITISLTTLIFIEWVLKGIGIIEGIIIKEASITEKPPTSINSNSNTGFDLFAMLLFLIVTPIILLMISKFLLYLEDKYNEYRFNSTFKYTRYLIYGVSICVLLIGAYYMYITFKPNQIERIESSITQLQKLRGSLQEKQKGIEQAKTELTNKLNTNKLEFIYLKETYHFNTYKEAENIEEVKAVLASLRRRVANIGYLQTISEKISSAISKSYELIEKANDDLLIVKALEDSEMENLISDLELVIGENYQLESLAIDESKVPEISLKEVFNTLNE